MKRSFAIFVLLTFAAHSSSAGDSSATAAFTFQGQLMKDGAPYSGFADFILRVHDSEIDDSPISDALLIPDAEVMGGLFQIEVDFGSTVFSQSSLMDRWLELQVRPDGDSLYTTLSPRQRILPVPMSTATRGIFVDDEGRVSIGTEYTYTYAPLTVVGPNIQGGCDLSGGVLAVSNGFDKDVLVASDTIQANNDADPGPLRLNPFGGEVVLFSAECFPGDNNLGIGTASPITRVDVRSGSDTTSTQIRAGNKNADTYVELLSGHSAGANDPAILWSDSSATPDDLRFLVGHTFGSTSTELARITGAGKLALGTMTPTGKLHVIGGGEVKADNDVGAIVLGQTTGLNLAFDSDEIMARNNGVVSSLLLNEEGGNVIIGSSNFGNLGIGPDAPAARLHVIGGDDVEPDSGGTVIIGATNGANLALDNDDLQARNNNAVAPLNFNAEGGDVLIGPGRLALGTASPSTTIDVRSQAASTSSQVRAANSNADTFVELWSGFSAGSNDPAILWSDSTASPDDLRFLVGDADGSPSTELARITGAGSLGLGTTAPTGKLHIVGGSNGEPTNSAGSIVVGEATNVNLAIDSNEIIARNNNAGSTLFLNRDSGNIVLSQQGTGKVGIGMIPVSSTSAKVSVVGGDDVELNSGGTVVVGATSSFNLAFDPDDIQARNNGAASTLNLNRDGGNVSVGPGTFFVGTGGIASPQAYDIQASRSSAGASGATTMGVSHLGTPIPFSNHWLYLRSSSDQAIRWSDGDDLAFATETYTNQTVSEKLRITSAGNLGIGTTTPSTKLQITGGSDSALADGGYIVTGPTSGQNIVIDDNEIMSRNNGAAAALFINAEGGDIRLGSFGADNGDVGIGRNAATNDLEVEGTASKSSAGDWLANSDARIKTRVETIRGALRTLDRVRLVSFRYTDEYLASHPGLTDRVYMNVIAQEFAEVFPEHVQGSGEYLSNGEEILQVDPYPLTIYAAAAVQELGQQITAQQERIDDLEAKLADLASLRADHALLQAQLSELSARFDAMNLASRGSIPFERTASR